MKKTILIRCVIALALTAIPLCSLAAYDLGFLVDNAASYEGNEDTPELKDMQYSGTGVLWFSTPLGETADLYISGGAKAQYEYREWKVIPELFRTELTVQIGENGSLSVGRMSYADPLGFIAAGLFDGARYSMDFANGSTLGIGAWYTGLLYKKDINITMTEEDFAMYNEPLDYGNFFDTYFAPKRLVAALDWEHPALKDFIRVNLSLIGQFDLSGNEILYHSQYLIAKLGIPVKSFFFELGGSAELAEMSNRYQFAFAGELGIAWSLPTKINDRLKFTGRFSSGTKNDTFRAFVPITAEAQGT